MCVGGGVVTGRTTVHHLLHSSIPARTQLFTKCDKKFKLCTESNIVYENIPKGSHRVEGIPYLKGFLVNLNGNKQSKFSKTIFFYFHSFGILCDCVSLYQTCVVFP